MGSSSRLEEKKYRCSLQHQLCPCQHCSKSFGVFQNETYRLEYRLSICKIQCTKYQPRLLLLIPLRPTPSQEIPLRLEVMAKPTSKSCVQRSQKYSNRVVARCFRQFLVRGIVELHGLRGGKLLSVVVLESVARGLLRGEGECRQQSCDGEAKKPHFASVRGAMESRGPAFEMELHEVQSVLLAQ